MELIDRKPLVRALTTIERLARSDAQAALLGRVFYIVSKQPTVDAAPVVRCRSCKHYNITCCPEGVGWCECHNSGTWDEWYCADGEAKMNAAD